MTTNKPIINDDIHAVILKRANKRYKSRSKVFNEKSLESNQESILKESKSLGLSHQDIQELLAANRLHEPAIVPHTADDEQLSIQNMQEEVKNQREVLKVLIMSIAKTMDKNRGLQFGEEVLIKRGRWI